MQSHSYMYKCHLMLGAGGVAEGHRKLTKARGRSQDGKVLYDDFDGSDDDQDDGKHNDDICIYKYYDEVYVCDVFVYSELSAKRDNR